MLASKAHVGDLVLSEEDHGSILKQGEILEIDIPSNFVKVRWFNGGGWATWEEAADVDLRDPQPPRCLCLCHDRSEGFGPGVSVHQGRCLCNAGAGFTEPI